MHGCISPTLFYPRRTKYTFKRNVYYIEKNILTVHIAADDIRLFTVDFELSAHFSPVSPSSAAISICIATSGADVTGRRKSGEGEPADRFVAQLLGHALDGRNVGIQYGWIPRRLGDPSQLCHQKTGQASPPLTGQCVQEPEAAIVVHYSPRDESVGRKGLLLATEVTEVT